MAFANLDQGINDAKDTRYTYLDVADKIFREVINSADLLKQSPLLAASYILHGWTLSEKGEHRQAIEVIAEGKKIYQNLGLDISEAYGVMSIVREYLALNEWHKVLEFNNEKTLNKRTRFYFARAHYELRNYEKAYQVTQLIKDKFLASWNSSDEARLTFYHKMKSSMIHRLLPPEKSAHTRYCESI